MKRMILLVLGLTFIWGCVVVSHCPGPPSHAKAYGHRMKYTYWYYPSAEVYYCSQDRTYVVLKGGQWIIVRTPPPILAPGSHYEIIEIDNDRPWLKHSHYKQKYPPPGKAKGRHK